LRSEKSEYVTKMRVYFAGVPLVADPLEDPHGVVEIGQPLLAIPRQGGYAAETKQQSRSSRALVLKALGQCQSKTQMGERIFIRIDGLGAVGRGNRVIDRPLRIAGGPEVMCQSRQMRLQVVLVDFLDGCTNLGV
jgi:hypothetical protein